MSRFRVVLIGLTALIVVVVACSEQEAEEDGVAMVDQLIACDGPDVWDRDMLLLNLERDTYNTIELLKRNLEVCGLDTLEENETPSPIPSPSAPSFSTESLELLAAYRELLKFKDEPWFHSFCYGQASPANGWGEYVTEIGAQTFIETGVTGWDLWYIGWDYCQNQGDETDFTKQKLREMEPEWLSHRPVPTPRPELRVAPYRP